MPDDTPIDTVAVSSETAKPTVPDGQAGTKSRESAFPGL